MLKKLALAALAAGALVAVRRKSATPGDADLWAEATRGPQSVSTPTGRPTG
ncbi:DLW-39 family protein [Goekera deserti]|uniref:DLW-39 family protein n=1 Tax=Goekera deserti TaxID=2497753 RepID=UPI00157717E9|nr:DLW-39 family protein [Goekera deserti]